MLFLNLLSILSFQSPESQTTHTDPVYVEIGPSTTIISQENFLLPLYDDLHDKVEYTEVKQTAEDRKANTDSKPGDASSRIASYIPSNLNLGI